MTSLNHQRMLFGLLVLLATWPFGHFWLVREHDLNPWKLFGMAMYCTPANTRIEIWDDSGRVPRLLPPDPPGQGIEPAVKEFLQYRAALGRLHSPAALAEVVLAAKPQVDCLRFRVGVLALEAQSNRLESRWRSYRYAKDADDNPCRYHLHAAGAAPILP